MRRMNEFSSRLKALNFPAKGTCDAPAANTEQLEGPHVPFPEYSGPRLVAQEPR